MIRIFLTITIIGFNYQPLQAQDKTLLGTVIAKSNQEPVPYVHIFSVRTGTGTISDLTGNFTLLNLAANDSIQFSCIGYKTIRVHVKSSVDKKLIVELEEDRVLLPEFTVHALSAKELVTRCVSKIPDNYSQTEKESKAFYWNAVRHDYTYTDFYEGYIRISQPRKILYDSVVASGKTPNEQILVFDSLQDILSFDVISHTSMFVNHTNIDDWKFEYAYSSEHNQESFITIEATMFDNPFKKTKDFNTLKIYIHAASLAIVRIDFTYRWSGGQHYNLKNDVQFRVSQLDGTVEYTKNQHQKYSLSYLFISCGFSFMKKYNPVIFKTATINHELVILKPSQSKEEKPVVRWGDYLEAAEVLSYKGTVRN